MNYKGFKVRDLRLDTKEKFVRCINDMWYFLDERGTLAGPFNSKVKAEAKLIDYIKYLDKQNEEQSEKTS